MNRRSVFTMTAVGVIGLFWVVSPSGNWLALAVFAAAGLTDLLDCWLAPRGQQV